MSKQIDVKETEPQNKHGHGRTQKCPIMNQKNRIDPFVTTRPFSIRRKWPRSYEWD